MDKEISTFKRWLILFNVSVSVFMATLDGSIVNIALPVISNELSVSISSIQWIVTSYLLTISLSLLIFGKISDIYGKKLLFGFGLVVFTIGSGLCGLSNSLEMLVVSRIIQALGASSTMALSQGIVTAIFPPNERGKALGITGTTVALGSLTGPSLGGVLVDFFGWHSIFFINIPIGIIGIILTFAAIPNVKENSIPGKFDFKGSIMMISSLSLMFLGLLFLQDNKIKLSLFIPMLISSIIILIMFISNEKKAADPLVNLNLFKSHVFSSGIISAFLSFVATFSITMFMPFYLQYALNLPPFRSGLIMSLYPAATAIIAPISGWLSDKISYRPLTVAGLLINTVVLFLFSSLNASSHLAVIGILMSLLGFGAAVFQSPNNSSVMGSVPRDQLGVAGGINALFRNLGMVSGVTLSVMLFGYTTNLDINSITNGINTAIFIKGFRVVTLFSALSCLLAAIISISRSVGVRRKLESSDSR